MNKKGFTLIEIIVSIAIIGIIIVGGFSIIGNNLNFLRKSRDMSVDTLLTQQAIELEISEIKNQLKEADHGLTMKNITIGGVSIDYHQVSKPYNRINYSFNVTPEQLPEYILLKTLNVDANLRTNTINTFSVYPIATSSALGSSSPDPATYSTHWMLDINQWYVSRPGFNIPVPKGPITNTNFKYYDYIIANGLEMDLGTRYPSFPDDYILLGTATTKTLSDLTNFGGRHLVYKVTAAAKSGRLGIPEVSDPIFVNALKNTNNLVVHLDASMIDPSYKDSLGNSHVDNNKVVKWLDLSSGIGVAEPTQSASTNSSSGPLLVDSIITSEFIGKYVRFENTEKVILNNQNTKNQWIYVFAVVRGDESSLIFSNGNNDLKIDDTEARDLVNGWKFIKKAYQSDNNNFVIGSNGIEIAEIIIYAQSSQLSDENFNNLSNEIYNLVESKYLPLNTVWDIDVMENIIETVFVGTPFEAPSYANALLTNGTERYVPVVWENGATVNTSTAGVTVLNGYASADSSKKITLTLNIMERPVESIVIDPNIREIDINSSPLQIIVQILPENATNKSLTWTTSNSRIVQVNNGIVTPIGLGTAVITATSVDNTSMKASVTITVSNKKLIAAVAAVTKVEGSLLQADYSTANTLVEALVNSAEKTDLQGRLVVVKEVMDARDALQSVSLIVTGPRTTNPYITLTSGYTWDSSNTTNLGIDTNSPPTATADRTRGTNTATLTATRTVAGSTLTREWVVTIPRWTSYSVTINSGSNVQVSP